MSSISPAIPITRERKASERQSEVRRSYSLYAFFAVLLLAVGWGLFVRFEGLGSRPLSVDEYFSVTSVQYILEKGVPEFPTGGYYMRALPLQYLQAASAGLFGDHEFAHRLPAALFGVFTLVFVFLYARIFLPWPLAATCVAMLAVSGWEIEFSRFSRMYGAFQCITVAFFLAYHGAYFGGSKKLRYLPHALALMAVIFHELGVFLLPFLFLPLLIKKDASDATPPPNRWTFAFVSCATTLAGLGYWKMESWLKDFHVQQSLPDGFAVPPPDSLGPLASYTVLPIAGNVLGAFLLIAFVAGLFIFFRSRAKAGSRNLVVDVCLFSLLLTTVVHLFAVSACIAALLFFRYQLHRTLLKDRGRLALLTLSVLTACAWVFYATYNQSWRERMLAANFPRALRIVFFGWPDFYESVFCPWFASLPFLTMIFLAALAWHVIHQGRQSITSILGHPIIIVIGIVFGIAAVEPIVLSTYKETRYFYNIYPFILLLIVMAVYEVVRRITGGASAKIQILVTGSMAMGLFTVSRDFNLRQLLHINSPEVTFRTGKFKRYEHLWFWRTDDRSPAEFLNAHRSEVDRLVVSSYSRSLPYYLRPEVDFAYYCSREEKNASNYRQFSRADGKLELWTGHPLLGTEQEIRAYTQDIGSLYLVRRVASDEHDFDINRVWSSRLIRSERAFLSSDGSTEVVKILLNRPDKKNPTALSGGQAKLSITGQHL